MANAGNLVNATNGYVNAYDGTVEAFDANHSLSPELKTFYDTELLENARVEMYYAQLGRRQPLPKGGGNTVEWRKWLTFARAGQLQEGVIPTGQKFGVTRLLGAINQYGTYTAVTDRLEMRAYDDVILGATEEMGASAAETQETLIRDSLLTGSNVLYCDNINLSSNDAYVSTPTATYLMRNIQTAACRLTPTMVNKAVTKLKKDRVPRINGKYVAVIHPSVAYGLRQSKEWIEAHKYADVEKIFNGEIGELHGVRFIEDVFAPVLVGDDLCAASRYLTQIADPAQGQSGWSSSETPGIALTDTDDGGETSKYCMTVDQAVTGAIVGRSVFILSAVGCGAETCNVIGVAKVTGVDASAKKVYVDTAPSSTPTQGAAMVPGEGAREYKTGPRNAAYATFFFGSDAFGIIDPEGGALEMIIKDKSQVGGPLNQFSTIGYKFETNGATILYPERLLRVMSCSDYGDTDTAN